MAKPIDESCERCGLYATCKSCCIGGRGSDDPDVFFVGEAPGPEEDERGKAFIGKAGAVLQKKIKDLGIDAYKIRYSNVVRCWPHANGKTVPPKKREIDLCKPRIIAEVHEIKPKLLVPLGKVAYNALVGSGKITDWAGSLIKSEDFGCSVIPVLHPSATLHSPALARPFAMQMASVAAHLNGKASKRKVPAWTIRMLDDDDEIERWIDHNIKEGKLTAFDYETTELEPDLGVPFTLNLSDASGEAVVVWFGHKMSARRRRLITRWLRSPVPKVAHNAKFECRWSLLHFRAMPANLVEDTQQLHHLLEEESAHNLELLAYRYTQHGGYDSEMKAWLAAGHRHHEAEPKKLVAYGGGDAIVTRCICLKLKREMDEDQKLRNLYEKIVVPGVRVLAKIENRGMAINRESLDSIEAKLTSDKARLETKIALVPEVRKTLDLLHSEHQKKKASAKPYEKINLRSPKQVQTLLYDVLGLPILRFTENDSPSTAKEILEILENEHPVLKLIGEMRSLEHEITVAKYVRDAIRADGTFTSNYRQDYVVTGRLSSSNPPAQNFKREGEVRKAIVSRWPGGSILNADYEQLELMLAANESKDPELIDIFVSKKDAHGRTAELIFGKDWTKEQRYHAKRVNFGVLYGVGPRELAWQIKQPRKVNYARRLIAQHRRVYPFVQDYIERQREHARRFGFVRSRLGRVRHLPGAKSEDERDQIRAGLQAGNFPIQAFAADITMFAMTRTDALFEQHGLKSLVISQVHDCVVADIFPGEEEEAKRLVQKAMVEDLMNEFPVFCVPLRVDIEIGPTW